MKIYFHLDFDAFFTSVEVIDNPSIENLPIVVCGTSHAGIVSASNYVAKSYGVSSAMPVFKAKKLLPDNAMYLTPRHERYEEVSREIFNYIKTKYCRNIYLYSIDECWLDFNIDETKKWESKCLNKAKIIQDDIFVKYHLTLSIGIGKSRFISKMASDFKKPFGITLIKNQEDFKNHFWNKPIYKMFMVGKSLSKKLNSVGWS